MSGRIAKFISGTAAIVLMAVVTLLIIEGASSVLLIFRDIAGPLPSIAEKVYTRYDGLLGWINIPDLYIEDMYGPGMYVETNSQSFRSDGDFAKDVPEGKIRIICSGDSFTFGYGVDNSRTWSSLLSAKDPHIETVNMGQGGYGVDQAYLWYARDGSKLEHDIHIFAFVSEGLYRMKYDSFLGYGKPVLGERDGRLIAENVPVPMRPCLLPGLNRWKGILGESSVVRLLRAIYAGISRKDGTGSRLQGERISDDEMLSLAVKAMESLDAMNREKGSTLVVVYLPAEIEFTGRESAGFREYLSKELRERDILFVDLVEEFRRLPINRTDNLFISGEGIPYAGAAGHYSTAGNGYIANAIYEKLLSMPETAEKLTEAILPSRVEGQTQIMSTTTHIEF